MNLGIVSSRYANALMKYAVETNAIEQVYSDMKNLSAVFVKLPELQEYLLNPTLSDAKKKELLASASDGGGSLSDSTMRFFDVVLRGKRVELLKFMAHDFVSLYYKYNKIIPAELTVALPISQDTEKRLEKVVSKHVDGDVNMQVSVDSSIGGGFLLEFGTYRIDASVHSQVLRISRSMIEGNANSN